MPETTTLGERIKRLRIARNLTLKDIEREAKVSATHVSEIERGLTSPTIGALARIAAALGIATSRLADGAERGAVKVSRGVDQPAWIDAQSQARVRYLGGDASVSVMEMSLSTGTGSMPPKSVWGSEVLIHVLIGSVETEVSGQRRRLEPGDSLHILDAAALHMTGAGSTSPLLLVVSRPASRLG